MEQAVQNRRDIILAVARTVRELIDTSSSSSSESDEEMEIIERHTRK